jgi:hypothetical protein
MKYIIVFICEFIVVSLLLLFILGIIFYGFNEHRFKKAEAISETNCYHCDMPLLDEGNVVRDYDQGIATHRRCPSIKHRN